MPRKFQCVSCQKTIVISHLEPGEQVACRHCNSRRAVPERADAATDAEDRTYMRKHDSVPVSAGSGPVTSVPSGDFGTAVAGAVGGLAWCILGVHMIAAAAVWFNTGSSSFGFLIGAAILFEGIVISVGLLLSPEATSSKRVSCSGRSSSVARS